MKAQMASMQSMLSSFFAKQSVPLPPGSQPTVQDVESDIAHIEAMEHTQVDAVSLADDNQSHFDDSSSRYDDSVQPEDLKMADVVRSCREIVGESEIPLPSTKESPSGLMSSLLRASTTEKLSLPQSKQFKADASSLHDHLSNSGHAGPLRPPKVPPAFFFTPVAPPIERFSLSMSYRSHNEAFSTSAPLVEAELGKGPFTPYLEASDKLARAMLSVSSALEIFSFSAFTKARELIGELPVELIRIQESAALAHLHLNQLISRSVANSMLAKRDIALKRCTVLSEHHKEALRVTPFDTPHLCSNLPQFAREQMIKFGEKPSFKRPAETAGSERSAKRARQYRSGGRGGGQQPSQPQQQQQPLRGQGPRGRGGYGRRRGQGRGQPAAPNYPPREDTSDKK